jgi:alpha-mannosidase
MEHERRFTWAKIKKRLALIEPLIYRHEMPIKTFRYREHTGPDEPGLVEPRLDDSQWGSVTPQSHWGKWRTDFTLRTHFRVPLAWMDQGQVGLLLNLGKTPNWDFCHPEALVYVDGIPVAGCDMYHRLIGLPARACDGDEHVLALHGYTGRWGHFDEAPCMQLFMENCALVQIDEPTQSLIAALRVGLDTARVLNEDHPAQARILNALDRALLLLDTREPCKDAFYASVPEAHDVLRAELARAGSGLDVDVTAVGHSHIDVAWLWPLAQTRRKCGRSFHTVLQLMEEFDQYRFTQSQAQLYDYVRQDYPELFQGIKQKVAQGRWEVTGGMWVESDCNVTGPESLVRQFLLGRSFFAEHFGAQAETPILWLPDVFGYPYCLPQLIKQAGLDYFFTTKLSWNQTNAIPYDSFWWQGIDGTRVLTHLGTTPQAGADKGVTYNGTAVPEEIYKTWTQSQHKDVQEDFLTAFGYGDGGGGPTREMLENIREMADFPGLPHTHHGRAVDFFRSLEEKAAPKLPTWNGELYLELHRGTYTTQARNKRANRKMEFLLHDVEWLASSAQIADASFSYPHAELKEAWRLVCLNQFHDIIPGSSVGEVYEESLQQYERVKEIALDIGATSLACLALIRGGDLLLANPTSFARDEPVLWQGALTADQSWQRPDGCKVPVQQVEAGTLIDPGPLGPLSIVPLTLVSGQSEEVDTGLSVSPGHLENRYVRVELNDQGDMVSVYDKTNQREVIDTPGMANQFQAFEDRPLDWDAWDIETYYTDKMWIADAPTSVQVVETGPLRASIAMKRRILNSEYTQRISLRHNSPQLDFITEIDWQEKHILLKVAFPVAIHANEATYEIQWGNVQRPTHQNTSWDWARFESCAQKWVDLSEGDYGVSLLNDGKYGHDIRDNVLRLTLLRSPTMPDPQADQGRHSFAYSLLPHSGTWAEQTIDAAYALNDPVIAYAPSSFGNPIQRIDPIVSVDSDHVVVETIKQAEDGRGIIIRVYEAKRRRGSVTVTAGFALGQAFRTNLLEQDSEALDVQDNAVALNMKPFEIVTLCLIPC